MFQRIAPTKDDSAQKNAFNTAMTNASMMSREHGGGFVQVHMMRCCDGCHGRIAADAKVVSCVIVSLLSKIMKKRIPSFSARRRTALLVPLICAKHVG